MPDAPACVWCEDIKRHQARLKELAEAGLVGEHPLVVAAGRRLRGAQAFDNREHGRGVTSA